MEPLTTEQLEIGVDAVRDSPRDDGTLDLIVRRPAVDAREVLEVGELDRDVGLVGDTWNERASGSSVDGGPHPEKQLNIMNARAAALFARSADRWALAGDQLFVDLDLSAANLPAGTRLAMGSAIIEVTASPHTGCAKFSARFGVDAQRFVNSEVGKELRLRGICARVVQPGTIRQGDRVVKVT
jgi:MOSC domain-containing protein YiiM